jgi:phage terminase large subunit-like protein
MHTGSRSTAGLRTGRSLNADLRVLTEEFAAWCAAFGVSLYDWQVDAFGQATQRVDGRFAHRIAAVSVARGNGKSYGAAAVGAWRLIAGPAPQLILSEALDFEGGRIVQDHAKAILRGHPRLDAAVEFRADAILVPSTGSRWLIRSRDHTSSRGLHPDLVIYDEVGWAKDDELFASLLASQASVPDPLMLVVSTVGKSQTGPLWRIKSLAEGIGAEAAA